MAGSGRPIFAPLTPGQILRAITGAATLAVGCLVFGQGTATAATLAPPSSNGQILIGNPTAPVWSGPTLTYNDQVLAGSGGTAPVAQASTAWALAGGVGRFGTGLTIDGTAPGSITTAGGVVAGGGNYSADDALVLLRRDRTTVPNAHAIRDESTWTVASGGGGYCAFDAAASYAGASAFNHLHAYQSRNTYTGSGSLTDLVGYWSQEAHTGTGTVTNRRGIWVKDPTGSGAITNNIGIDIESLTRGATLNLAIRSLGVTPSTLGGQLFLGSAITTASTPALTMQGAVAGDFGFTCRNTSAAAGAYAYYSMRNDATSSVLFTSYGSAHGGSEFGVTTSNYTALLAFGASNNGLLIGTSGINKPVIFGVNSSEQMRLLSGGLAIGASALLASERLLVSGGGVLPAVSSTQIAFSNGGIACGAGITCKGITSVVAGVSAVFDSGAASDSRMEFKRNGVRQGLFTWDTGVLRFEGDVTAGSAVYFKAGGADRLSVSSLGVVTVLSASDGSLTCNGRITAKVNAAAAAMTTVAEIATYIRSIIT